MMGPVSANDATPGALDAALRRADKLGAILEVAQAMAARRSLDDLLPFILRETARVLDCERCSLLVLDRDTGELRSRVAQGVDGVDIRVPLGQGLAGTVAQTGEVINLRDAYDDPRFDRTWDVLNRYRTTSVLCVPMRDTRGEITGVIQALNANDGSFDGEDEVLIAALAGQAAQAIENARLHQEIEQLFEGFVQASVMAIESRDPTTAGHSGRVASLTVSLAEHVERAPPITYPGLRFSREQMQEIRYASLLHDFGKIGVREPVLVKADKLYPHEFDRVRQRFELARRDRQLASARRCLEAVRQRGLERLEEIQSDEQRRVDDELAALDDAFAFVVECNKPTVLAQGGFERLDDLRALCFHDSHGREQPLLLPDELSVLAIPRGSLSATERKEIESHVSHTWRFLSQIPWTRALRDVPRIAYAHHEKLDGRGYPQSLAARVIPVQSKMMAIADIYDALTASDRPYKRAVPHEAALRILRSEAGSGQLDAALLDVFIEAEIPRRALDR